MPTRIPTSPAFPALRLAAVSALPALWLADVFTLANRPPIGAELVRNTGGRKIHNASLPMRLCEAWIDLHSNEAAQPWEYIWCMARFGWTDLHATSWPTFKRTIGSINPCGLNYRHFYLSHIFQCHIPLTPVSSSRLLDREQIIIMFILPNLGNIN